MRKGNFIYIFKSIKVDMYKHSMFFMHYHSLSDHHKTLRNCFSNIPGQAYVLFPTQYVIYPLNPDSTPSIILLIDFHVNKKKPYTYFISLSLSIAIHFNLSHIFIKS